MSIIARHSGSDAWMWRWMIPGSVRSSQRRVREPGGGVTQGPVPELTAQNDALLQGVVVRAHSLCQADQQPHGELVRGLGKPPEGFLVQHEELRRLFRSDRRGRGAAREQG